MKLRSTLLAAGLAALPGLALAQTPAASNPKLAAYVGHSCSYSYPNGITVWDDFSIQGGNIVTHHHSKTPRASQDAGVLSPTPVGDGSYRYKVQAGTVYTLHPQANTATIAVTADLNTGGTVNLVYNCK